MSEKNSYRTPFGCNYSSFSSEGADITFKEDIILATIPGLFHPILPHYSKAECGTPLTLRIFLSRTFRSRGGDYTGVVPPVPIPNTEVKYSKADDSRVFPAKVGSPHLWLFFSTYYLRKRKVWDGQRSMPRSELRSASGVKYPRADDSASARK